MRRAILLAGVIFAVGIFTPASGLAKAGGTDLPYKGKASGSSTLNTQTGAAVISVTGKLSHLGKFSETEQGFIFPGCGQLCLVSTFTQTAASGAEISGSCSGSGTTSDGIHLTFVVNCNITDGTGRFKDASGSFVSTVDVTRVALDGVFSLSDIEARAVGNLSLNR